MAPMLRLHGCIALLPGKRCAEDGMSPSTRSSIASSGRTGGRRSMGVVGSVVSRWLGSMLPVSSRRRCSAAVLAAEGLAMGELMMRNLGLLLLCKLAAAAATARCWRGLATDAVPCGLAFGLSGNGNTQSALTMVRLHSTRAFAEA